MNDKRRKRDERYPQRRDDTTYNPLIPPLVIPSSDYGSGYESPSTPCDSGSGGDSGGGGCDGGGF